MHCNNQQHKDNMFVNLVGLALCLGVVRGAYTGPLAGGEPATQFPAGVDPQSCPNYPVCENPAVAVNQAPISQYQSQINPGVQYNHNINPVPVQQYNQLPQYNQPAPQYTQPQYNQQQFTPAQQYNSQYNPSQYNPTAYNSAPRYNAQPSQQQQYAPQIQAALDRGDYIGDGDYHGEGLREAGAVAQQAPGPAYNSAPQYNPAAYSPDYGSQAPTGAGHSAQLPAGLAPGACPNYPFCQ